MRCVDQAVSAIEFNSRFRRSLPGALDQMGFGAINLDLSELGCGGTDGSENMCFDAGPSRIGRDRGSRVTGRVFDQLFHSHFPGH